MEKWKSRETVQRSLEILLLNDRNLCAFYAYESVMHWVLLIMAFFLSIDKGCKCYSNMLYRGNPIWHGLAVFPICCKLAGTSNAQLALIPPEGGTPVCRTDLLSHKMREGGHREGASQSE